MVVAAGIDVEVLNVIRELGIAYGAGFARYLPAITKATLIITIGYFLAQFLGWLTKKILYRLNLDIKIRKADLTDSFGKVSLARLFGTLTKWFVFFVFFAKGLSFLEVGFLEI